MNDGRIFGFLIWVYEVRSVTRVEERERERERERESLR